ncbi:MAG TPA: FAD-binding oxidoreductase [Acidimicrobiales bacterium]|nr:FAD-binding oxidoreductase [Acidimicrobiales bacterium]
MGASVGIETFRKDFAGQLLTAGDADYDQARSVWNGDIDRRPAAIAQCSSAAQVAAAIGFARDAGLELTVRGGGHNFGGLAVSDGGLMVDLSPMGDVTIDAAARRARVAGGATWASLDGAAQAHGLAVTGGFISHTGVGGLTLGGGFGWLTRKLGTSCDNVVSAEVVTADGRVLRASDQENPDLFWAIRGGGGNFGVVTSLDFQLHEVGPLVNLALFFFDVDRGGDALRFARDYAKTAPDSVAPFIGGMSAPPAPFVPEQFQLMPGYGVLVVGWGSPEEHAAAIAPIREAVTPTFEFVTPIPYVELQKMFDEGNPWGILAYEKALYLDDMSDGAIDVFTEYLPQKASPMSFCPVFPLGGKYAEIDDDATAFGGSRNAGYIFNMAAICPTPELFEADRAWVRRFYDALLPHASGAGSYVNFINDDVEARVRASYGDAKYERLARIKADYDPDNVFRHNVNIKPAGVSA